MTLSALIATSLMLLFQQTGVSPDSLSTLQTVDEDTVSIPVVYPFQFSLHPGFEPFESDSTIRWFMTLDGSDVLYNLPGAVAFRSGTSGRPPGFELHSYNHDDMQLRLYNLDANDPVNGQIQWLRLPVSKIRRMDSSDWGVTYRLNAELTDQYLTQPRTFLNFVEGSENYRSLEFAIARNITPGINVELSYLDRKDGSRYEQSNMNGSQIVVRGRYNLNDRHMLKIGYANNSIDQEQPFGYQISDLNTFDFNPYNTSPLQPTAFSSQTMNDLFVQLFTRKGVSEPVNRMVGFSRRLDEWSLPLSQDTSHYAVRRTALSGWQRLRVIGGEVQLNGLLELAHDSEKVSLSRTDWTAWSVGLTGSHFQSNRVKLDYSAHYSGRNDAGTGYEMSGRIALNPLGRLELSLHGGLRSRLPDVQALYWQSPEWTGNPNLENEQMRSVGISLVQGFGSEAEVGVRADRRTIERGITPDNEKNFANISPYRRKALTAWVQFDLQRFEGSLSATHHLFESDTIDESNRLVVTNKDKTWIKGSLYWKNYLFNRATYVKAGVSGLFSPGGYQSSDYLPRLNRWVHGPGPETIPSFYRVDLDVSARIRWMMLLIKWENILDQLEQPGYFETTGYPMPGRRLIFGLRVLFTN